jgi:hypothetical protein
MPDNNRRPLGVLEFVERVMTFVATHPRFSATSWGRTDTRNASVGGAETSVHKLWLAIDLVPDGILYPEEPKEWLRDAKRLGLWAVWHDKGSGFHLHLQGVPPL